MSVIYFLIIFGILICYCTIAFCNPHHEHLHHKERKDAYEEEKEEVKETAKAGVAIGLKVIGTVAALG